MSDPSDELKVILERLSYARSNWERAQLLFQSWRKVRSLGPEEREQLALHMGIDGVEDLIDHLAQQKGKKAPPELNAALRSLHKEDPKKVARLLSSLQSPDDPQRQQVIAESLQEMGAHMLDAAAEARLPAPAPAPAPPLFGSPASLAAASPSASAGGYPSASPGYPAAPAAGYPAAPGYPPAPAAYPAASAVAAHPSGSVAWPAAPAAPSVALPGASLPSTSPEIPSARAGAAAGGSLPPAQRPTSKYPAAPPASHDHPTAPATPVAQARASQPPRDDAWSRLRPPPHDPDPPETIEHDRDGEPGDDGHGELPDKSARAQATGAGGSPAQLPGQLRAEPQLLQRFRMLHGATALLPRLDDDGCDQLVECFPAGWARRRALAALLAAGAYPDRQRAERAIAGLDSPAARRGLLRLLSSRG